MALGLVKQVSGALKNLNPDEVRQSASRPLEIGLVAPSSESMWRMESFFCPPELSPAKRAEVSRRLHRVIGGERTLAFDIEVWDDSLACPDHVFPFDPANPEATVKAILKRRPELALTLARNFPPFRKPVIDHAISKISNENALFSLATALPDILPSLISIPWAIGEFASDTAFLTGNQIRLTFMIAAASDREIGYSEQKAQIGSILAGAFGFRAIARELVGKIPFGGGLVPKAAVSYAGTYVLGRSLERLYSVGYGYTKSERKSLFEDAIARGREIAGTLLDTLRPTRRA